MYATADQRAVPLMHSRCSLSAERDHDDGASPKSPQHADRRNEDEDDNNNNSHTNNDDDDEEHIRVDDHDAYESDDQQQVQRQRHSRYQHSARYSRSHVDSERDERMTKATTAVGDLYFRHQPHPEHEHVDERELHQHHSMHEKHQSTHHTHRQSIARSDEPDEAEDDDELDDNAPLDLSLPAGRRRDRTFSGTDSDDSSGPGCDDKVGGKAAYKKNLMKRYCKFFVWNLFVGPA